MFLDNCSDAMKIQNRAQLTNRWAKKEEQRATPGENEWIGRNRLLVINAAVNTHHTICPTVQLSVQDVLLTVEQWAFQPEWCEVDTNVVQEDSVLSLAQVHARDSFIEIRNGLVGQDDSMVETRTREATVSDMTERRRMERTFEGTSYRLTIKRN